MNLAEHVSAAGRHVVVDHQPLRVPPGCAGNEGERMDQEGKMHFSQV